MGAKSRYSRFHLDFIRDLAVLFTGAGSDHVDPLIGCQFQHATI